MKYKVLLAFTLILHLNSYSFAQLSDPIILSLVKWSGNNSYSIIIGSNRKTVIEKYNSINALPTDKQFNIHKYVVSQKALKYISSFIQKNCTQYTDSLINGENVYYLGTFSKNKKFCYIPNMELAEKYFASLNQWLKKSEFKKEFSPIEADIQAKFIEGRAFPLTIEQKKLLKINKRSAHKWSSFL